MVQVEQTVGDPEQVAQGATQGTHTEPWATLPIGQVASQMPVDGSSRSLAAVAEHDVQMLVVLEHVAQLLLQVMHALEGDVVVSVPAGQEPKHWLSWA